MAEDFVGEIDADSVRAGVMLAHGSPTKPSGFILCYGVR